MSRAVDAGSADTALRSRGARRGPEVIVVGAGVVGSACALGLAQAGIRVALVEARAPRAIAPDADRDLRVFAIAPASSRLLRRLGVWDAIPAARAHAYREMRVWDAGAAGELHFSADALGAAALGHIVEQAAIQQALWQALGARAEVQFHCPARIVGLEQDDHGATLELDDGARVSAPLVVAADGAESPLRALAGLEVDAREYRQHGVVGYVATGQAHADTAWQRFLPTGPLALLPCSEQLGSIVWTLPDAEAERVLALDDEAFARELTQAFGARLGLMRPVSPRASFPLRLQLAQRYVAGRVVLIGDAAHVVHPLAGQGVNLGLQDVIELLDLVVKQKVAGLAPGSGHALRRFERARRSENAIAGHAFGALNRLFSNDALLPTLLRGPALGLVDRLTPLKRLFASHAMGPDARDA